MKSILEEIKQIVADVEADVAKAESGVKASGPRIRKAMQALKDKAQEMRVKVLDTFKSSDVDDAAANVGKQVGGPGAKS